MLCHTIGRSMKINKIFNCKIMKSIYPLICFAWFILQSHPGFKSPKRKRQKKTSESIQIYFTQKFIDLKNGISEDERKNWLTKRSKKRSTPLFYRFFFLLFCIYKNVLRLHLLVCIAIFAKFIANSRYKMSLWLCLHFGHW